MPYPRPSITIRIFSSAENRRRVFRRMSRTAFSADAFFVMDPFSSRSPEPSLRSPTKNVQTQLTGNTGSTRQRRDPNTRNPDSDRRAYETWGDVRAPGVATQRVTPDGVSLANPQPSPITQSAPSQYSTSRSLVSSPPAPSGPGATPSLT